MCGTCIPRLLDPISWADNIKHDQIAEETAFGPQHCPCVCLVCGKELFFSRALVVLAEKILSPPGSLVCFLSLP